MARNDDSPAIDVDYERSLTLRDAIQLAGIDASTRQAFTKKRRQHLIELLAQGLSLSAASREVGVSNVYVSQLRRTQPAFDEAVTAAIELGTDPVADRMVAIALHGNPESMATVSAAKLVLQGRNAAYRDKGGSVRLERRHPDGTVDRISAGSNGIPD